MMTVDSYRFTERLRAKVAHNNRDVEVIRCDRPWEEVIDLSQIPLAFPSYGSNQKVRCSWSELGGPEQLYISPYTAPPPYAGQIAREYIHLCLKKAGWEGQTPLKICPHIDELTWQRPSAPILYQASLNRPGEYAHIDMIAAYWQILSVCCLDTEWYRSTETVQRGYRPWQYAEAIRDTTFPSVKEWRKAIYGSFNRTYIDALRWGNPSQEPIKRGLINFGLYDLMIDTLWAVVLDLHERWPFIMWQVDGGVVLNDYTEDVVYHLMTKWHIDVRIDSVGPLHLVGPSWKIGAAHSPQFYETTNLDLPPSTTHESQASIDELRELRHDWWMRSGLKMKSLR